MTKRYLPYQMQEVADRDCLPGDHKMRTLAADLDDVIRWTQDAEALERAANKATAFFNEYTGGN